MGIFGRRQASPAPAPDTARDAASDAATARREALYDEMTARADDLRGALHTPEARRLVVALEWSWATTAGGGISEPPTPDADVLVAAFRRLGEADVVTAAEAYVAADRALCTGGLGLARRPPAAQRRLEELAAEPAEAVDLSYGPHEALAREMAEVAADLEAASGWRLDVEDLAGCVRWWPGRPDRAAAASADPLRVHLLPRIMVDRPVAEQGDWRPSYDRLKALESGAGLAEPVEPDRWVLAALARRPSDRGGLG
jgi:hypothetical protein